MKKEKKPDQVVFDEETQTYHARTLSFASNVSAPKIEASDVTHWKNNNISKVNHQLNTKFNEIKAAYEELVKQYQYNELIYQAKFSFEPIVGQIYHLYQKEDLSTFLSVLAPTECNFKFIKSFKLNANAIWEAID